jgi:hypothetical protein
MLATLFGIDCVYDFFITFEAILNERKQHSILFLAVVKKSTDMASIAECRASEPNRPPALIRVFLGELNVIVSPVHRGSPFWNWVPFETLLYCHYSTPREYRVQALGFGCSK